MFITVIQITATEFILTRFQNRRGALQFIRGVRHRLTDEESNVADILASWQKDCLQDRIVLALPPTMLVLRELDLPLTDRKKGRAILPLELKGELAAESDEAIFDALPLAGGKTAAIWSRQSLVSAEIDRSAAAGFDPEVVTFALFSWQHLLPQDCSGTVAITDGEAVAVYLDRKPVFFRVLPGIGARPLDATLTALEISRDISIATIFTLGSGPLDTERETTALIPTGAAAAAFAGDSGAAVDLAAPFAMARELVSGDPVNLRRGTLGFTKSHDRLRRKLRITWGLAALLLILIFVEAGIRYYLAQRDVASLNGSIRTIYREVFPTRTKPVDEVAEMRAEIKKLGAAAGDGLLSALKTLTEAKGDEPREMYEIDFDGSQVTGRGYDRSAQGVNDFKAKAAPLFAAFEVSEIKSRPDGSVSFAFRGTLKGGGK